MFDLIYTKFIYLGTFIIMSLGFRTQGRGTFVLPKVPKSSAPHITYFDNHRIFSAAAKLATLRQRCLIPEKIH